MIATATIEAMSAPASVHIARRAESEGFRTIGRGSDSSAGFAIRSSICMRASPISRSRRFGSLVRHQRSSCRSRGGTSAGNACQFGSVFRTDASVSEIVSPAERARAREHLEEHRAERPDVGALVRDVAARLLRATCTPPCRGSRRRPSSSCGLVIVGEWHRFRRDSPQASVSFASPKSSTLTVPSARSLMFAGFRSRWMMPSLVRRFERFGDLPRDRQRLVERHRAARDPLGEVFALDQLHHERVDAVRVLQPVDGRDVRMIQGGEDFGFALEARQPVGIARQAAAAGS